VLGDVLCDYLARGAVTPAVDLVVPVPLHWRRRVSRGFNQATLLALEVGARFSLPVAPHLLRRERSTRSQTAFSGLQRSMNVRDAFALRPVDDGGPAGRLWARVAGRANPLGKRILLIDDILTTGSTSHECARALCGAGAQEVVVVTVARTRWTAR